MDRAPEQTDDRDKRLDTAGRSRRRLVAGGATAAVMLTIPGRPAWGSSCTPSAMASANASGRHDYNTCASKSAGYWKTRENWPSTLSPDADFHAFFGGMRFFNQDGDGLTLIQVINLTGGTMATHIQFPGEEKILAPGGPYNNEHQIGLHAVGALVNTFAFPFDHPDGDFGFTTQQVIDLYNMNDAYTAANFFEDINNQFDS